MNLKEQIAQMQREIEQWQKDPSGSAAMKRQLQALQSELDNLVKRTRPADRRRPRLAVVKPTPPPQVALTDSERAVWSSFFHFHKALLQYSGWVNRDQWLQMADVAADMTGGNPMLASEFPTEPGIWVWDGTSQLWIRTRGIPFPSGVQGIYGWDAGEQRWVLIEEGGEEMGITDGSNAAPGRVGELMVASHEGPPTTPVPIPLTPDSAATYVSITSLQLTAGDWDLAGAVSFTLTSPAASYAGLLFCSGAFSVTLGPGNLPGSPTNWGYYGEINPGTSNDYTEGAVPVNRINITAPTTVYLVAHVAPYNSGDLGKTIGGAGMIRARRMR